MKSINMIWKELIHPEFNRGQSPERITRIKFAYQNILVGFTNVIGILALAIYYYDYRLLVAGVLSLLIIYTCLWLIRQDKHHMAIHLINLFFTSFIFTIPFIIGDIQLVPASFLIMLMTTSLGFKDQKVALFYLIFFCVCSVVYIYLLDFSPHVIKIEQPTRIFLNAFVILILITYVYFADIYYKRIFLHQQHLLENTEKRYEMMVSNIDDIVLILDDTGKVEYASPSVEKTTGYHPDEMIGTIDMEKIHPSDLGPILAGYQNISPKDLIGQTFHHEYRTQSKHKGWIWCDCSVTFFQDDISDKIKIVKIGRDVTEKKRITQSLEQKAKELDDKNKELKKYIDSNMQLENFAYFASHDLREPLRTIVGFSQLLQKRYIEVLDQTGKEFLGFIIRATNDMNTLIADLLEYSRVNTPNQNVESIQPTEILESIVSSFQNTIAEKKAQISWSNLPDSIIGNPMKLKQLFQNLIANGIKFNRPNTPPVIHVSAEDQKEYWQLSISDNGIGIEPEFHQKIFLLFKKLHSKAQYEGTGIGLALCKKIVEQHGGRIWLESDINQGTTFYFTLSKHIIENQT